MKKRQIFLCAGMVLCLTACGNSKQAPETTTPSLEETADTTAGEYTVEEQLTEWENPVKGTYTAVVSEYDGGERTYQAQSGKSMPYRIRAIAGMPKEEGTYPLVLITHGSHENMEEGKRFDTGFSYLVEALAAQGYVAVSMDMSSPYLWKYGDNDDKEKSVAVADEQIRFLKTADQDPDGNLRELAGKIDWDSVTLIGHSRGGETVFEIARDQIERGIAVTSLIALAPTAIAELDTYEWPDVQTAVLVPEYDGDVSQLDGFLIQRELEKKMKSPSAVTMLRRANHNYFNSNLTENDALLFRSEAELSDQLSAAAQQEFFVSYVLDCLSGKMWDQKETLPDRMYGQDTITRVSYASDQLLASAKEPAMFKADNMTFNQVSDSWFFEDDEVIADTITTGHGDEKIRQLLDLRWEGANAAVTVTPAVSDFTRHHSLSISLVIDPAGKENEGTPYQRFSVTLKDRQGNQSTVVLADKRNSLRVTPGKLDSTPLENREIFFWSVPTPLPVTAIPLKSFEGINLSDIESITLSMDQNESGALYLESISLQ